MNQEIYTMQYFAEGITGLITALILVIIAIIVVICLWRFRERIYADDFGELTIIFITAICFPLLLLAILGLLYVNIPKVVNPKYYVLEKQIKTQKQNKEEK